MATTYPTLDEVLALHHELLVRFGGQSGVRDLGLLDSALARPLSGQYSTIFAEAAAILQSLALNHPFIDGNKRVAVATAAVMLRLNSHSPRFDPDEAEQFIVQRVIVEKVSVDRIAEWLVNNTKNS